MIVGQIMVDKEGTSELYQLSTAFEKVYIETNCLIMAMAYQRTWEIQFVNGSQSTAVARIPFKQFQP